MLPDTPFLQPCEALDRLCFAARLQFGNEHAPATSFVGPLERQRLWNSADVNVFEIAVITNQVEDDAFGARVAKSLQRGILRMVGGFLKNGVEYEFALFETAAGQPFNL